MTEAEDLLEMAFLKLALIETDEGLESYLDRNLASIISVLSSPSEKVKNKVIELLTHVNKRVKNRPCIQLPVEELLSQYEDKNSSAFITNFAIIYIKLGFPRLPDNKKVELLPRLISSAEAKLSQHRQSLVYLLLSSIHLSKFPTDDKAKDFLGFDKNPSTVKLTLQIVKNILLFPYGYKPPGCPPEISNDNCNQLVANIPDMCKGEVVERFKMTCIKLLSCGVFDMKKTFALLVIASGDPRTSVSNAAENQVKRIIRDIEHDKEEVFLPLYLVYLGSGEGSSKTFAASTRLRLKILPHLTKSTYLPLTLSVKVLFDSLYGENTNSRLRTLALQYCRNIINNMPESKLSGIGDVMLKSGLLQLVRSDWAEPSHIAQAFSCIGPLVARLPTLASHTLLHNIFQSLIQEREPDLSNAMYDCLVAMSPAYKECGQDEWLKTLSAEALNSHSARARSAAIHYLRALSNSTVRVYLLLTASHHLDESVGDEAKKTLYGSNYKKGEMDKEGMPAFDLLANTILEGELTKPCQGTLHSQMVFYLRLCLANSSGATVSLEQLSHPCEESPKVASYLKTIQQSQPHLINKYAEFILRIIEADIGVIALNALVELLGCLPEIVSLVQPKIDKLMLHLSHNKEPVRVAVAQLVALGLPASQLFTTAQEFLEKTSNPGSDLEKIHGHMMAAGYILERAAYIDQQRPIQPAWINNLIGCLSHSHCMLVGGACQSLALISRALPLPLSLDEKDQLCSKLFNIVTQQKYSSKVKEDACRVLGTLCVAEDFPCKSKIIDNFLKQAKDFKDVEMVLSVGETLVLVIMGKNSADAVEPWTRRRKDDDDLKMSNDVVEGLIPRLLAMIGETHPNIRQCSCFWLLSITKHCSMLEQVQKKLDSIQDAFMELLSDSSNLVQEAASRGLAIVYQSGVGTVDRSALLSKLVDQLASGKRSVNLVSQDTRLFEEGQLGKAPTGGGLSTYKELCSLASDLNKPDLIYKFMSLANHNAVWNSKKGAAFGVSTLAEMAGPEIENHLPKIIAKLYRYQYDPTPGIQQAMAGIWKAFTANIPNVVEKYSKEILNDLLENVVSGQWRVRQSCCKALTDFIRSPSGQKAIFQECSEHLVDLWTQLFRVMDDIHEATRDSATTTTKTLARLCVRTCEKEAMKDKISSLVLPVLLEKGIKSNVSTVRAVSVTTLSDLVKIGVGENTVVKLVPALLTAVQELDSSTLSHLSVMVSGSQVTQEVVDSVRASAVKSHFTVQTLQKCVSCIKADMLQELCPQLVDLLKGSVSMTTRLATCHFLTLLCHSLPKEDIQPYIGKILGALLHCLGDRNAVVRKQSASTLGQLASLAKDQSLDRLLVKLNSLYFDKQDAGLRMSVGLTLQAMLGRCQDAVKSRAAAILPLAFIARHQIKLPDKSNEASIELWEEVCDDIGGTSLLLTHAIPVSDLLIKSLQSQEWSHKAQAACSIKTLATKLGQSLPDDVRVSLINSLKSSLPGRTWDNKHFILHALATLAKFTEDVAERRSIIESLEKECSREKLEYKCEAIRCLGDVLAVSPDISYFDRVHPIVTAVTVMEQNEENKDIIGRLVEVSYETLGKSWPGDRETQDKMIEEVLKECVTRLEKVTRQIQVAILNCMLQMLEKMQVFKEPQSCTPLLSAMVDYCCTALTYSLSITTHSGLKKASLNLMLFLINRTKCKLNLELKKIESLYLAHKEDLELNPLPEINSRLADIKEAFRS